jgi:hypothetical protein
MVFATGQIFHRYSSSGTSIHVIKKEGRFFRVFVVVRFLVFYCLRSFVFAHV